MIKFCTLIIILACYPWSSYGARYIGNNAHDAGQYIDNSQGKKGFDFNNPGHPRDHSSTPNAPANYPCVEHYSQGSVKSGFDSRAIQNEVGHLALSSAKVKAAIATLNQYNKKTHNTIQYKRQVVSLTAADLGLPKPNLTGGRWTNGKKTISFQIHGTVIVLQHFNGKQNKSTANVHIQTFYPN